jgi:hypothetical protein
MSTRIAYSQTTPVPWHGAHRNLKAYGGAVSLLSTDLASGQVVALFTVPKGFTVTDLNFDVTKLDAGGSPALTFSIGDAANPARFLANSSAGQTAEAEADTMAAGCLGFKFSADTDILFTVGNAAATAAPGTLTLFLKGFIDA